MCMYVRYQITLKGCLCLRQYQEDKKIVKHKHFKNALNKFYAQQYGRPKLVETNLIFFHARNMNNCAHLFNNSSIVVCEQWFHKKYIFLITITCRYICSSLMELVHTLILLLCRSMCQIEWFIQATKLIGTIINERAQLIFEFRLIILSRSIQHQL